MSFFKKILCLILSLFILSTTCETDMTMVNVYNDSDETVFIHYYIRYENMETPEDYFSNFLPIIRNRISYFGYGIDTYCQIPVETKIPEILQDVFIVKESVLRDYSDEDIIAQKLYTQYTYSAGVLMADGFEIHYTGE